MSQNPGQRLWSDRLQCWYTPSRDSSGRSVGILPNGAIIPLPAQPAQPAANQQRVPRFQGASRPNLAGNNDPNQQYDRSSNSNYALSNPASTQVAAQFEGLSVGGPSVNSSRNVRSGSGSGADIITARKNDVTTSVTTKNGQLVLLGTEGDEEPLDSRYQKRKDARRFFKEGKVFATLWTEPTTSEPTSSNKTNVSLVKYGECVYTQIRRFVVTREDDYYCEVVPITTYGGQAGLKKGINRSQHALIYSGPRPGLFPGETGLMDVAIAVDPTEGGENLDRASRVNLGTPHTIQHNLKVKPCGMVRNVDDLLRAVEQARRRSTGGYGAREAPPSQNTPISPVGGRPGPGSNPQSPGNSGPPSGRGAGRGTVPQSYNVGGQQPGGRGFPGPTYPSAQMQQVNPAGRGMVRAQTGQANLAQYSSQAAQQAMALQRARAQQSQTRRTVPEEDGDSSEDEEDDDDDDDDDDARRRRQY